ncbi:hypothetical protein KKF97_19760, partial [Myxococcota bacterium]|nr:hypothetical protein [Myxococcota bacterium]
MREKGAYSHNISRLSRAGLINLRLCGHRLMIRGFNIAFGFTGRGHSCRCDYPNAVPALTNRADKLSPVWAQAHDQIPNTGKEPQRGSHTLAKGSKMP